MARRSVITVLDQLVENLIQLYSDRKEDEIDYLRFTESMVNEMSDRRDNGCPPFDLSRKEFTFQGHRAVIVKDKPGVVLKWCYYGADPSRQVAFAKAPEDLIPADEVRETDYAQPIEHSTIYFPRPLCRSWCGAYCARSEELRIVIIWT